VLKQVPLALVWQVLQSAAHEPLLRVLMAAVPGGDVGQHGKETAPALAARLRAAALPPRRSVSADFGRGFGAPSASRRGVAPAGAPATEDDEDEDDDAGLPEGVPAAIGVLRRLCGCFYGLDLVTVHVIYRELLCSAAAGAFWAASAATQKWAPGSEVQGLEAHAWLLFIAYCFALSVPARAVNWLVFQVLDRCSRAPLVDVVIYYAASLDGPLGSLLWVVAAWVSHAAILDASDSSLLNRIMGFLVVLVVGTGARALIMRSLLFGVMRRSFKEHVDAVLFRKRALLALTHPLTLRLRLEAGLGASGLAKMAAEAGQRRGAGGDEDAEHGDDDEGEDEGEDEEGEVDEAAQAAPPEAAIPAKEAPSKSEGTDKTQAAMQAGGGRHGRVAGAPSAAVRCCTALCRRRQRRASGGIEHEPSLRASRGAGRIGTPAARSRRGPTGNEASAWQRKVSSLEHSEFTLFDARGELVRVTRPDVLRRLARRAFRRLLTMPPDELTHGEEPHAAGTTWAALHADMQVRLAARRKLAAHHLGLHVAAASPVPASSGGSGGAAYAVNAAPASNDAGSAELQPLSAYIPSDVGAAAQSLELPAAAEAGASRAGDVRCGSPQLADRAAGVPATEVTSLPDEGPAGMAESRIEAAPIAAAAAAAREAAAAYDVGLALGAAAAGAGPSIPESEFLTYGHADASAVKWVNAPYFREANSQRMADLGSLDDAAAWADAAGMAASTDAPADMWPLAAIHEAAAEPADEAAAGLRMDKSEADRSGPESLPAALPAAARPVADVEAGGGPASSTCAVALPPHGAAGPSGNEEPSAADVGNVKPPANGATPARPAPAVRPLAPLQRASSHGRPQLELDTAVRIYPPHLRAQLGREVAEAVWPLFDINGTRDCSRYEFVRAFEQAYDDFRGLRASLRGHATISSALTVLSYVVLYTVLFVVGLFVFQANVVDVFVAVGTLLVPAAFALQTAVVNAVQSIVFVIGHRAFEVGDWVGVALDAPDTDFMEVAAIDLLTTTFNKWNGRRLQVPNFVLATLGIENHKRSARATFIMDFRVGIATSAAQLHALERRIALYLESQPLQWLPHYEFYVDEVDMTTGRMAWSLWATHRLGWDEVDRIFSSQSSLLLTIIELMTALDIVYYAPSQPIVFASALHAAATVSAVGGARQLDSSLTDTGAGSVGDGRSGPERLLSPSPSPAAAPSQPEPGHAGLDHTGAGQDPDPARNLLRALLEANPHLWRTAAAWCHERERATATAAASRSQNARRASVAHAVTRLSDAVGVSLQGAASVALEAATAGQGMHHGHPQAAVGAAPPPLAAPAPLVDGSEDPDAGRQIWRRALQGAAAASFPAVVRRPRQGADGQTAAAAVSRRGWTAGAGGDTHTP
jgi:hypothetical protein